MSVEMILGGIGTFLGVANFVYWVWWAKREKVTVLEHSVYARILTPGEHFLSLSGQTISSGKITLSITISCLIILLKGQDTEIRDTRVKFNEDVYAQLGNYFQMPLSNRISLNIEESYTRGSEFDPISLQLRKSVFLVNKLQITSMPSFEKAYAEGDITHSMMQVSTLLQKLSSEYNISWVKYDGKDICWYFPDRWRRNLGKKLWG
ncbi:hypothetical protein ACFLUU_05640 [Chloroflexota bacterium]